MLERNGLDNTGLTLSIYKDNYASVDTQRINTELSKPLVEGRPIVEGECWAGAVWSSAIRYEWEGSRGINLKHCENAKVNRVFPQNRNN